MRRLTVVRLIAVMALAGCAGAAASPIVATYESTGGDGTGAGAVLEGVLGIGESGCVTVTRADGVVFVPVFAEADASSRPDALVVFDGVALRAGDEVDLPGGVSRSDVPTECESLGQTWLVTAMQ